MMPYQLLSSYLLFWGRVNRGPLQGDRVPALCQWEAAGLSCASSKCILSQSPPPNGMASYGHGCRCRRGEDVWTPIALTPHTRCYKVARVEIRLSSWLSLSAIGESSFPASSLFCSAQKQKSKVMFFHGMVEGPVSSGERRKRMAALPQEKQAGKEERDSHPQASASSPSPWSITEPSHLLPSNSFSGTLTLLLE